MVGPDFEVDVLVVGGAGHVGFPLAVAFASRGLRTCIYDIDESAVDRIMAGHAPFLEPGVEPKLDQALTESTLRATTDVTSISRAEHVVVVVGTPVDGHLSPDVDAVPRVIRELQSYLRAGQLLVLRSTVYPGVTARVERILGESNPDVQVAFCPERIAEGKAMTELFELPQIVASRSPYGRQRAASLFGKLTTVIVEMKPEEAELAKLFTNSWRYLKFAAANQFYMIAAEKGLDYELIRQGMSLGYPRAADIPRAGFAAGPCLFKDTMQLSAASGNTFALGHAAMLVNEGLPDFVVRGMEREHDLSSKTIGILGMAFKGESDDTRASLSYKLKRLLQFRARAVVTTDPYVAADPELHELDYVLAVSDILVIGAPHRAYGDLVTDKPVVDVWGLTAPSHVA